METALLIVGLACSFAARVEMRTDDIQDEAATSGIMANSIDVACVDCPGYVGLSAQDKENVLWSHIVSDEYMPGSSGERTCADFLAIPGTCHCYGEVKYGQDTTWTSWKKVSGSFKCGDAAVFGDLPGLSPWKHKQCVCKDEFPMKWRDLLIANFKDLLGRANNGTMPMFFDRFSDVNPANNMKVIHTYGAVAKVKMIPAGGNHGFTGMFDQGFEHGLLRLSIVADWTKPCKGGTDFNFDGCLKPSLALKMLRDADFSSNAVAQVNLGDGVGWHFNFFKFSHATWLPSPGGLGAELVKYLFSFAAPKPEIGGVGVHELGSAGSKANQDPIEVKAPKILYFVPAEGIRDKFHDTEHDPRQDFVNIEEGTPIYDIITIGDDPVCWNGENPFTWDQLSSECMQTRLGTVVTTSRFVASDWGDRRLFFQHERLKTKNGKWSRKMCMSSSPLPSTSEFRMPHMLSETCTVTTDACPFSKLEQ